MQGFKEVIDEVHLKISSHACVRPNLFFFILNLGKNRDDWKNAGEAFAHQRETKPAI